MFRSFISCVYILHELFGVMVNVGPVTTSTGCSSLNTSQELLSTVLRQLSFLNSNTQFLEECYFEYTSNDITCLHAPL